MNKIAVGAVGAVAVVGAVIGGAAWSGQATQKHLEAEMARFETQLPFKVTQAQYDKKLFSATYTVVLQGACEGEDGPSLSLVHRIQHGPLAGGRLGWAVVETELLMPDVLATNLKDLPAGQPLVHARTVRGLLGGIESRIKVPALTFSSEEGGQLKFQEMALTLSGSAQGAMSYELAWPGLSATLPTPSASAELQVGALSLRGQLQSDPETPWMVAPGKTSLEWKQFEVTTKPTGASKPTHVLFTDIRATGDATRDKDLLSKVTHLQAQGMVNAVKVSNIDMKAALKRVHLPSYVQLMQEAQSRYAQFLQQAMCHGDVNPMENTEAAMASLNGLLPHNPEMSLDKLAMEIDGQAGELSYAVGTQGVTADDVAGPDLRTVLFAKAYASGQAKLPMAWLEKLAIDPQPERQTQDRAMLDAMVSQAVDAGYVVREGALLRSEFKLDKGQLLVNGKPIGPQLGAR